MSVYYRIKNSNGKYWRKANCPFVKVFRAKETDIVWEAMAWLKNAKITDPTARVVKVFVLRKRKWPVKRACMVLGRIIDAQYDPADNLTMRKHEIAHFANNEKMFRHAIAQFCKPGWSFESIDATVAEVLGEKP